MPNYKEMYKRLFNSVTDAIEILQQAQVETEEIYITSSEDEDNKTVQFKVLDSKDPDEL